MIKNIRSSISFLFYIIISFFIIISFSGIFWSNYFTNSTLNDKDAIRAALLSESIISLYQDKNYRALQDYYSPYFSKNNEWDVTTILNRVFLSDSFSNPKIVGFQQLQNISDHSTKTLITLEYQGKKHWATVETNFFKKNNANRLIGIRISLLKNSLEDMNRVSFAHVSLKQFAALVGYITMPIVVLIALIMCSFSQDLKRKWLWFLFIIFGFCSLRFNWTTQAFSFQPIAIQLFGVSYFRESIYSPLVISLSIPIGALIFLVKKYISDK